MEAGRRGAVAGAVAGRPRVAVARMRASEAAAVARLFREILAGLPYYNDLAKRSERAKYTASALRAMHREDPDAVLVARVDSKVAGFCISKRDDTLIWLSWFGVRVDVRRHGIGSLLLAALDATGRARCSHKIWCDCRTDNEASAQTLACHGYTKLCAVRNHWYGQDFYLWEKAVS